MSERKPGEGYSGDINVALEQYEEQRRKENRELLGYLGEDFNTCWDALMEEVGSGDMPKEIKNENNKVIFNQKKFLEAALFIQNSPHYLEYIKRLIKEDVTDIAEKQSKGEMNEKERVEKMKDLALNFIARLEFFSRLKLPVEQITTTGKSAADLVAAIGAAPDIYASTYSLNYMEKVGLVFNLEPEQAELVRVKVEDFFSDNKKHALKEIYEKAAGLGLELCPADVGPAYRLAYRPEGELKKEQPINERLLITVEQVYTGSEKPGVFLVHRVNNGAEGQGERVGFEYGYWAQEVREFRPDEEFVFRLRSEKN